MKFYFAGAESLQFAKILDAIGSKRRLVSFYYLPTDVRTGKINIHDYYGRDKELFLDSGAYSAFTKGVQIKIEDLIRFIKDHNVELYVNLDDINSWQQTKENQRIMENAGLHPFPVWHIFEPFDVLKEYCAKYPYVALGFGHSESTNERSRISSSIFEHFSNTKFHMFAITTPELMIAYPFYSVDSTTWLNPGKYGHLPTPWGYVEIGNRLVGRHLLNMTRKERIEWESFFKMTGFDGQTFLTNYDEGLRFSAKYFLSLEAAINSFDVPKKGKKMLDSFFNVQQLRRKVLRLLKAKF